MKEVIDKEGFFKDLYGKFRKTVEMNDLEGFCSLKTDKDRIRFFKTLTAFCQIEYPRIENDAGKNEKRSLKLKEAGNILFQKDDNAGSLRLYNESILNFPIDGDKIELAKIRANRSASLYYLQEYDLALHDISAALALGYPKDLRYKILERKAKCLLAQKQHQAGLNALRETLSALDDAKLPVERRQKCQRDIQITTAIMVKNKVIDEKVKLKENTCKFTTERHPVYRSASKLIEITKDDIQGRHAVAASKIESGKVILKENAHCTALLQENTKSHCFHCLKRAMAGEPCPHCTLVKFCSPECLNEALKTHHSVECSSLATFWSSGASVTCSLALRAITQRPISYFLKHLRQKMSEEFTAGEYLGSDYSTVHALVRHEKERSTEDFFHRAFMAMFLLDCLKKSGYFNEIIENKDEAEIDIGGLLLRNLQIFQFNAHEVFELQAPSEDLRKSKTVFVGAAVYPTLALFNHSCDPSIVRYFKNSKVIVRSIKVIKKGELISENYGPIFTQTPRDERRAILKSQYWFDCECEPCSRNWPTLDEMSSDTLRFLCDRTECDNVLVVPSNTMNLMIQCGKCGQNSNILKGLKVLQDSENVFKLGQSYLSSAQVEKASRKFLELQSLLGQTLVPPFKDYYLCTQGLRTCFVALGSVWPPLDKLKKKDERSAAPNQHSK